MKTAERLHQGTVTTINPKGFGFIHRANGEKDIFFHCSDLAPDLEFGESLFDTRVEFSVRETEKGPKAVEIRRAD